MGYTPGTEHADRALSELAIAYSNRMFIGGNLLGEVKVGHKSDEYFVRSKRDVVHYESDEMGVTGRPQSITGNVSTQNFSCRNFGLEAQVPVEQQENADEALDPRADATEQATARSLLAEEIRIATLVTTAANYATGNSATLSGSDQWNSSGGGDPIGKVLEYRGKIWRSPTSKLIGWCGWDVFRVLMNHPQILERIKYGGGPSAPAKTNEQILAQLFAVDEFYVGEAEKETANLGQTASYSRVWGADFGMVARETTPTRQSLHFGSIFRFRRRRVDVHMDEKAGMDGVEIVQVKHSSDYRVVANDAGFLLKAAVA